MIIGIPKEIKSEEYRVGITPDGAKELRREGHTVLIEQGAGTGSGFHDNEYLNSDADLVGREILFSKSDLIVKVKEPLPSEYGLLREGQILFTYLHLAPNRELTELLLKRKVTALGYETLRKGDTLPLLLPMSEVAGRMAPLIGALYLQKFHGGSGILPTGAAGVKPATILILGAGVVGSNAARIAHGLGMDVVILNRSVARLRRIDELFMGEVKTMPLTAANIAQEITKADIIVGALLLPGGRPPLLIKRGMLKKMKNGSVLIDVSIDQGGCAETSRPTTHDNPVYNIDGVIHYTVANMPGAYPRTSTLALTNATLPYIKTLSGKGIERAIEEDSEIQSALNTYNGRITHKELAEVFNSPEC